MGWGSASGIFSGIILLIQPEISDMDKRVSIYKKLIRVFEDGDWDTQDECLGIDPAYDQALKDLHPGRYEYE